MAGRIRTIKPELLEDERVADLSSDAFRLFVGCILLADDYGNFRMAVGWLAGQVFWRRVERGLMTQTEVESALSELLAPPRSDPAKGGLVSAYSVGGQIYGHIAGWEKHQRVVRAGKPRVPGPNSAGAAAFTPPSCNSHEGLMTDLRPPTSDLRPPTSDLRPPTSDHRSPTPKNTSAHAASEPTGSGSSPPAQDDPRRGQDEPTPSPQPSAPGHPTLTLVPTEPAKPSPIETVFAAYVAGWRTVSKGHRPPSLTDARRKLIAGRLREFSADALALACRGIWASHWHVESNQTSIELALRNAGQIEKFAATCEAPTRIPGASFFRRGRIGQAVGDTSEYAPEES